MTVLKKLTRIAAWLSQGVNVMLPGGHQDQTFSARAYVHRDNNKGWYTAYRVLNTIFFWQADHCKASHMSDIEWARELLENEGIT